MAPTQDIIIAGGAVMGSAIAWSLASDPAFKGRILVVERDMTYQTAASALSASGIRQQFSCPANIRASLYGIDFLRNIGDILEVAGDRPQISLKEGGYLTLASAAGRDILAQNQALQCAEGADIALLDAANLAQRFPWLNVGDIAAGAYGIRGEGWFDGYGLMQAFRRKARHLGVAYRPGEVVALEQYGDRIAGIALADGSHLSCGAFVNACGASGARRVAKMMGVDIPVVAKKRCVFTFSARDKITGFPLLIDPTGVYVRPEGEGYICGVSPDDLDGVEAGDFDVDWHLFDEIIWPVLAHRIPAFETIRPGRAWAGHYDMNLFDHNALAGRAPGLANAWLAAGFSGHGLQHAPAIGRGLAELILHGRFLSLDLSDFCVERIVQNKPLLERNVI